MQPDNPDACLIDKINKRATKRQPGGGRKPTGIRSIAKQICLPDNLWLAVDNQASRNGQTRSEWMRHAIANQIGKETGIWLDV